MSRRFSISRRWAIFPKFPEAYGCQGNWQKKHKQTWRHPNIQPNNKTYKHIERYQTSTGLKITCASSLSSEFFIDDRLRKCLFSCFARVHHPQRKEHNSQSRKSMVQKSHLTYPLNILGLPMITTKQKSNKNRKHILNRDVWYSQYWQNHPKISSLHYRCFGWMPTPGPSFTVFLLAWRIKAIRIGIPRVFLQKCGYLCIRNKNRYWKICTMEAHPWSSWTVYIRNWEVMDGTLIFPEFLGS